MTPPADEPSELKPGAEFAGDFVVLRKIGEGGMGAVFEVAQRSTGARRALKVMGQAMLDQPRRWERFEREARISASIRSEHVVKVLSAGVEPSRAVPYLVMELLDGEGLDRSLARGPLPLPTARVLLDQLCHGLGEMHSLGIVHRDVKPENIFLARAHRADVPLTVKLLDFGLARSLDESGGVTQAVGTPYTMAPEQTDPRAQLTAACDVWALGLVAFQVLTGRRFWLAANHADGTLQGLLAELVSLPIPGASERLGQLGASDALGLLPTGFDDWLERCLRRDPAARFASATEAWRALGPVLGAVDSYGYSIPASDPRPVAASSGAPAALLLSPFAATAAPDTAIDAPLAFAATAPPPASWSSEGRVAPAQTAPALTPATGDTAAGAPTAPTADPDGGTTLESATDSPDRPRPSPVSAAPGRRRRWLAALAAGGVVAGLLGAWGRPRTLVCREVRLERDQVRCVGELSEAQAAHRAQSFRVRQWLGRTRWVELRSSAGQLVGDEAGLASWRYEYGRAGVEPVEASDEHGQPVLRWKRQSETRRQVLSLDGRPQSFPGARYSIEEATYDGRGRVERVRFLTELDAPATDAHGAFGYRLRHDDAGRVVEQVTLGADGQPSRDDGWVERRNRTYDASGNLLEEAFLTAGGQPARSRDGCASLRRESDAVGNLVRMSCHDEAGRPTQHRGGYTGWTARYDDRGQRVEVRRIAPDGTTVADQDGVAVERTTHDALGRLAEIRRFAADGAPALDSHGVAGTRLVHDARGDLVEQTFLDDNGAPTFHQDGYATVRTSFDQRHRPVERRYLGPSGEGVFREGGYAIERLRYDDSDNVSERSYFDPDGKPVLNDERYAVQRTTYDDAGWPREDRFLGVDGRPVRTAGWYAVLRHRHDDRGNEIETEVLDTEDRPTLHREGYARLRRKFDERNEEVERAFFDAAGNPTRSRQGAAFERVAYDARGLVVGRSHHDRDGRLAANADGEVAEQLRLDEHGQEVERSFVDALGRPVASRHEGYATVRTTRDAQGRPIELRYTDASGAPTPGPDGAPVERQVYDAHGWLTERHFVDADGAATIATVIGAAHLLQRHDSRGRVVEWTLLGLDGHPVVGRDGYAVARTSLDARGRQTDWSYFDADGNPTRRDGYARLHADLDARGRRIGMSYADETGAPARPPGKGAPEVRMRHDERGNPIEELLLGPGGTPSDLPVARHDYRYDERDLRVEVRPFAPDGQPTDAELGLRLRYDERGFTSEVAFVDAHEQPCEARSGVSIERQRHDETGRLLEQSFFDRQDRPVEDTSRQAARLRLVYDELGRRRAEEAYDVAGRLVRTRRFDGS